MPNPNAVVSNVIHLEPPLDRAPAEMLRAERGLSVELEGGRRVRLDPANPRSVGFIQILDGLSKQRLPVYLEVDPATSTVTRLLIPHVTRVVDVQPGEHGLDVEWEMSHARHVLRRGVPDFAELEQQLRESMRSGGVIIATEDDVHSIIDIRSYTPGPDRPIPPFPPFPRPKIPKPPWPLRWLRDLWRWRCWPWWWFRFRCMSAARAQQVFDAMAATTCNPLTVPPPCIPYLYPDDGCWGRAHEMCRLMVNMGVSPKKVWIQAAAGTYLQANTRNNPVCYVRWGWHVAPTVCVRRWWWWFFCLCAREMVIDPALFTTPVTKATWKGVQNNPGATLTDANWEIFYLWSNDTDPTFVKTNQVLATYRLQLQLRSLSSGPPPYANCP